MDRFERARAVVWHFTENNRKAYYGDHNAASVILPYQGGTIRLRGSNRVGLCQQGLADSSSPLWALSYSDRESQWAFKLQLEGIVNNYSSSRNFLARKATTLIGPIDARPVMLDFIDHYMAHFKTMCEKDGYSWPKEIDSMIELHRENLITGEGCSTRVDVAVQKAFPGGASYWDNNDYITNKPTRVARAILSNLLRYDNLGGLTVALAENIGDYLESTDKKQDRYGLYEQMESRFEAGILALGQ